jgi:hypothetical protein
MLALIVILVGCTAIARYDIQRPAWVRRTVPPVPD